MSTWRIIDGDCIAGMRTMADCSVQCCVTSPPYWGLRDYGHDGQIGLEDTPDAYVARMVEVFREVRRVLRDNGTLWLNLGDSYAGGKTGRDDKQNGGGLYDGKQAGWQPEMTRQRPVPSGFKPKDLCGIPWRVAFALQADGWWLRQDIIWHKPNPMPESVTDRCTKAHEYVFLMTKSERYFFDAKAIAEEAASGPYERERATTFKKAGKEAFAGHHNGNPVVACDGTRNRRSVWSITTKPYSGAHFATMPPDLVEPCILAGSKPGDTILDPFTGSGTTGAVAVTWGRNFVGTELNPTYIKLAEERIGAEAPLFATQEAKP